MREDRQGRELALIIPVYNEQDLIGSVLEDWLCQLRPLEIDFEIHVYDDGSTDGTSRVIDSISRKNKEVIGHHHANKGHGPTILEGHRNHLHFDWIFQADSDNEISPSFFKFLWKKRDHYDFLIGKRCGRLQNPVRRLMSLISRFLVHVCYHSRAVWDVNSPFRLMRPDAFDDVIHLIPPDTFAPNLIISGMASLKDLRILEMDVDHQTSPKSSLTLGKSLSVSLLSFFQTIKFRIKNGKT